MKLITFFTQELGMPLNTATEVQKIFVTLGTPNDVPASVVKKVLSAKKKLQTLGIK